MDDDEYLSIPNWVQNLLQTIPKATEKDWEGRAEGL
jgi:hypothetical protein